MQVSQNQLSELTGRDRKTIRRLLSHLEPIPGPHKAKLYESQVALETVYYGSNGHGEFITTAEATRRLTIAKEREIVLDMEIKRGSRIPLSDVAQSTNEIFQMFAGTLKANRDKVMSEATINEIFEALRTWVQEWKERADAVEPCHPTLWKS